MAKVIRIEVGATTENDTLDDVRRVMVQAALQHPGVTIEATFDGRDFFTTSTHVLNAVVEELPF